MLRDANRTRSGGCGDYRCADTWFTRCIRRPGRSFDFEPSPTDQLHQLLLIKDARALLDRA